MASNATLSNLLAQAWKAQPDTVIAFDDRTELTAADVDKAAQSIALQVAVLRCENSAVAVMMERSAVLLVAYAGVLFANRSFCPLEPAWPKERLQHCLKTSQAHTIICNGENLELAKSLVSHPECTALDNGLYLVHSCQQCLSSKPPANLDPQTCYVFFTSGSTGMPKGVPISHAAIINRLQWMRDIYRFNANDVFIQKTPNTFDVSVWEVFLGSLVGARTYFPRSNIHLDPQALSKALVKHEVTAVHFVPSLFRLFQVLTDPAEYPHLREVIFSGESMHAEDVAQVSSLFNARASNLYGPTEAAVDVTYYLCKADEGGNYRGSIPIGVAAPNVLVGLRDEAGEEILTPGVAGEIVIAGVQVAQGYLGVEDSPQFRHDLPFKAANSYFTGDLASYDESGQLCFIGRRDRQVKILGTRIELDEIESVLIEHTAVQDAAVIVVNGDFELVELSAYVQCNRQLQTSTLQESLERHLASRLPAVMVPNRIEIMEDLPRTVSGKRDYKQLGRN